MKNILVILMLLAIFSCNTKKNQEEDSAHATYDEQEEVQGEEWNDDKINEFLQEAAMINEMQIDIGKMAQEKASNESVGIYGKLLYEDHSKALKDLMKIAQSRNMNISDTLDNEHSLKVAQLSVEEGHAFDRKFLEMMEDGHRKDIQKYENALTSISKSDVKAWIDNSLANLRNHLQKAQQLQNAAEADVDADGAENDL